MRALFALLLVLMAGVAQVTVASLFPLRGAVVEFGLLTVVLVALVHGPRAAMVTLPFAALAVGFASNRAPALLILAYLPVLPVAAFVEEARFPVARYLQLLGTVAVCGIWARGILTLGPIAQGADLPLLAMLRDLIIPGIVLDFLAFTVIYVPIRMIGRGADTLTLERGRYAF